MLERHGAVSPEVAEAMARGARERLGADVAVAVTGVAGPGGGTKQKPVGTVFLHAEGPDGGVGREFTFPGDRGSIRARSVVGALHLVRRLLTGSRDEAV
jgi:nicotinamide-nucleotide amidase